MGSAAKDMISEYYRYLADPEWRIDNLYYIQDKEGNTVKFVRNESQRELWANLWYNNLILKDRQRGFSTGIAIFILDTCMFVYGTAAGIIDITLPDARKKLKKITFAYARLPEHLRQINPLITKSTESLEWENGSSVNVGISHRGGTLQILHVSEIGKIAVRFPERAREIRTGAYNTVAPGGHKFIESTAEGNAGDFYDACQEAMKLQAQGKKLSKMDFRFHFFAWWMGDENELDPEEGYYVNEEFEEYFAKLEKIIGFKLSDRKKAWYVKKTSEQKGDMKREYPGTPEEAFEANIEGAYLADIISLLRNRHQITHVPFEPGVPVNTGWDFGLNDAMTIWLHQRVGLQDRIPFYIEGNKDPKQPTRDVTWFWKHLRELFPDVIWGNHFIPHDGGYKRIGTSTDPASPPRTLEDILEDAGMNNIHIVPRIADKKTAIEEVRLFLPKCYIDVDRCAQGTRCLQNFRKVWDESTGRWLNKPLHDWAMDGYDGFESLTRGLSAYGVKLSQEEREAEKSRSVKRPPPNWRAL